MINQRKLLPPRTMHEDFDYRMNHDDPWFEYDFMLCVLGSRQEMLKDPNDTYRGGWLRIRSYKPYVREIMETIDWCDDTFTTAVLQMSPWFVIEQYDNAKRKMYERSDTRRRLERECSRSRPVLY